MVIDLGVFQGCQTKRRTMFILKQSQLFVVVLFLPRVPKFMIGLYSSRYLLGSIKWKIVSGSGRKIEILSRDRSVHSAMIGLFSANKVKKKLSKIATVFYEVSLRVANELWAKFELLPLVYEKWLQIFSRFRPC